MEVVEGVAVVADVDAFVADLADVGAEHGVAVQAFDARYVVDREHLERAVALANRAVARGEAIADDRAVEILCYAAGRRQIERALTMGVDAGEVPVVVVVDGGGDGGRATAVDGERGEDGDGGEGYEDGGEGCEDGGEGCEDGNGGEGDEEAATANEAAAARAVAARLEPASTLGDVDEARVRQFFDVTDTELAAAGGDLAGLVRERVALLVVNR